MNLISAWLHYTDLLEEILEEEPFLISLTRRWSTLMSNENESSLFQIMTQKVFATQKRVQSPPKIEKSTVIEKEKNKQSEILFVPSFSRINCLGVSQNVAQSIWEMRPNCTIGIIPPEGNEEANLPFLDERFYQYNFHEKKTPSFQYFPPAWRIYKRIRKIIQDDLALSKWFRKRWYIRVLEIARYLENKESAVILLQQLKCREIICLNEQIWPASALIPAAKELGIKTCQILHGTPTRLYWPFISDETWVWGEGTYNMFLNYGAPSSKLFKTGNLESSFWLSTHGEIQSVLRKSDSLKCLFLSQWAGSRIWGVTGFDEPVTWLSKALLEQDTQWEVIVRLHPNDDLDAQEAIKQQLSFLGDRLVFSDKSTSLAVDIAQVDFVCTGSSTAILMSLTYGIPSLLLWTPVMDYIHGQPFLNEQFVVFNDNDLAKKMFEIKRGMVSKSVISISEIRPDANIFAAQHILAHIDVSVA